MYKKRKYVHFTDEAGVAAIKDSNVLWQSSYGPSGAIFAVVEGGSWVPGVQISSMGRARTRTKAIVFTTKYLPDYAMPEEVMWHLNVLPIEIIKIVDTEIAKNILNDTIPQVGTTEFLQIELHPSFNDFGDWKRMPEDFSYWTPGIDDEKYLQARKIWLDTKDVGLVRDFWNKNKLRKEISLIVKEIFRTRK